MDVRPLPAAFLALALPAAAAEPTFESWLYGTWCGNLDVMRVDEAGMSFNDDAGGIVCRWKDPPSQSPHYRTTLTCEMPRAETGGGAPETWTGAIDFTWKGEDALEAYFEGDPTPVFYTRCDP